MFDPIIVYGGIGIFALGSLFGMWVQKMRYEIDKEERNSKSESENA